MNSARCAKKSIVYQDVIRSERQRNRIALTWVVPQLVPQSSPSSSRCTTLDSDSSVRLRSACNAKLAAGRNSTDKCLPPAARTRWRFSFDVLFLAAFDAGELECPIVFSNAKTPPERDG